MYILYYRSFLHDRTFSRTVSCPTSLHHLIQAACTASHMQFHMCFCFSFPRLRIDFRGPNILIIIPQMHIFAVLLLPTMPCVPHILPHGSSRPFSLRVSTTSIQSCALPPGTNSIWYYPPDRHKLRQVPRNLMR